MILNRRWPHVTFLIGLILLASYWVLLNFDTGLRPDYKAVPCKMGVTVFQKDDLK